MPKTELEIDREVCEAATGEPWVAVDDYAHLLGDAKIWGLCIENAAFIARARTRYPALVDEVEKLRALVTGPRRIPRFCVQCPLGENRLVWDGHTLRCPHCGVDALEVPDGA